MPTPTPAWQNIMNQTDPADPTGSADSTPAINDAIAALGSAGGVVYFPPGQYRTTGFSVQTSGVTLLGDGPGASKIFIAGGSANCITIGGGTAQLNNAVSGLEVFSSGTPAAGALILVTDVNNTTISNVWVTGGYDGIAVTSTGAQSITRIESFKITSCANSGISLGDGASYATNHVGDVFLTNGNINSCNNNILISNASGVYAKSIDSINGTHGVIINPASGQGVNSCHFDQVLAATASSDAWSIAGSGNQVVEIILISCWASGSTSAHGLHINNSVANGILVQNSNFHENSQDGILITAGANINISNNMVFNNSVAGLGMFHGIVVANSQSDFQITGNISGRGGFFGIGSICNQGYGIFVGSGGSNYIIQNNRCPGNQTGGVSAATGTTQLVGNNLAV